MPNCAVDNVFAPNGEPSQLWEDLQNVSRTQDEALRLYLNVKNEPIPEEDLDANGEAQIEAVLDRDDLGFRPRHRASRLHRSTHTPTGTSNEIGKEIGMDAVAEQLDRAIERLRLEGSTLDEGSAEKQRINEQVNQLQDQKAALEENKSIQSIRSVAQNHRQMIEEVLRMPNVSQQQLNFVSMLVDAWDYDRTTKYYLSKAQRQSEDPLNQALQDINDKFEDLQSEVDSMVEDVVMDNIREYWGDSISREEALNPPDGNFAENLSNIFFDMTRFDSPLAQRFANTLRMNVIKKNRWIRDHKADIQESLDEVDDLTRLLAENEEGEKVVSLINPYNVEYYARRQATLEDFQQATEEITSKPAMIRAKRNFLERFSNTDEVIDVRYLVEDLEDDGEFDSPEAYREYLRERHGEKTGDELADDALNGWQNYQDHLMGKKEALETDLSTGSLTEQEYREDLQRFKRVNNPLIATREFKDGDVREAYNKGHRYVTYAGKPKFQDDKYHGRTEDGLTDTEREAADKLRQLYAKMMDYLPTQKVRDTQENFLPVVKKEWEEILTDEGVRAMGEEMKNEFFSDFMSDEEAGLFDDDQFPDAFSGLTDNKSIPIRHLNDAAVSDKFQSEDVQKMTDQFIAMVGRYHFMKKARPKIELMGRIVEEVTGDSNKGLTLDDMSGDAVFESSMRHTVNALMFEQHREDEYNDDSFIVEGGIGSNIEAKKKRRNIKKRHKKLYKRYEDGEITKETYENQAKKLDEEMKELGGKKWSFTRFVESTLGQYTMLKGLGWAPLSGLNNVLFGMMANSVEAASGEYFTDESYTRAIQTYWRLWKEGSEKIPNLMQTFNIFFEVAELAYGKKAKKDKESFMKRALKDPMILMNEGETFIQGIAMVAYMMEEKVQVNENGEQKEVSLWEAFNEQGRWDEERFGYNEEFQGTKEEQQEIDRHALRVVQVIKRIHGNFDTSSPLWLKSTAIGRMLSMFKTWMFEGFAYRFGSKQYDEALGKYVKGSYRSAWDQWIESDSTADFFQDAVALARANDVEAKAEELGIADYDAYSIKRALREMRWWARTMMAMVVLKTLTEGIDEEEDSPAQATGMAVYNTLFRLNQDTTFYLNPATAVETAKNPVPAMQTLGDFIRAFESTKSYLTDPDYQGNPASQVGKNIPGVSSAYSMYYIANNDLSNVR